MYYALCVSCSRTTYEIRLRGLLTPATAAAAGRKEANLVKPSKRRVYAGRRLSSTELPDPLLIENKTEAPA